MPPSFSATAASESIEAYESGSVGAASLYRCAPTMLSPMRGLGAFEMI